MPVIATCHCGASRIELPNLPTAGTRCNCTFCARTGAVWAYFPEGALKLMSSEGQKTYSASGNMNGHHFCGTCGMQTWGESPDWGSMYNADGSPKNGDPTSMPTTRIHAINLNLIDDLDWSKIEIVEVDGRNNW